MMFVNAAYDNLGLPAYLVNPETYEVLYINGRAKEWFGDITGRKCHEALNRSDAPCACCANCGHGRGPCRAAPRHLAAVDKYVDTYASAVGMPDGGSARLCLLADVTEQERLRQRNEERERAARDLRRQMDIQNGFIHSAKSMMSASTLDGAFVFVNEIMSRTLGYTEQEILGMHITDIHPPDVAGKVLKEHIPQALAEGEWKGDCLLRRKDGSVFPIRQIVFPIKNEMGETLALATIMDDITETLELERMSRYQRAIMECTSNYIGVSDLTGKTMYHSPGAYRMLGYEPGETEEWVRSNPHPDWYYKVIAEEGIPTAMEKGQWVGCGEIIDRFGKHIPIEQTIFPVFDDQKAPMGVATIIQDITEKVAHEKEIDSARRMLRTIIDTAPSAIFWKGRDSRFLGSNRQFAQDAGFDDPSQLVGLTDYDLYPRDIADIYVEGDREMFRTGNELLHFEEPFQGADGVTHWVSTSKVLIRGEDEVPYALLGIYDDITNQKQNETKLEEAIAVATEASRAKSDFLSRMSHEIRTPMNAIIGMTKIGQSAKDKEKMQYCLEKIDGASKHLLALINDILDMSKIEANKLDLSEDVFHLEKMLESVCNVIHVKAEEKRQNLFVEIGETVPDEIVADEMRIAQVVTNLLSNAVKFTPEEGTIRLNVENMGDAGDGRLRLSVQVADNGIGLTDAQIAKLFHSFEQAESGISRRYGGTGLGLAISKKIVELMDGEIGVTSVIGGGSTFAFTILVKRSDRAAHQAYNFSAYQGLRVLVADASAEVRSYFERLLGSIGAHCGTVDNGAAAVGMIVKGIDENAPYQIAFIDHRMEGMDGIETSRKIKALAGDGVHIVMLSQTEWSTFEEHAKAAGVDHFVPKPLFQSPVLDAVNQLLFRAESPPAGAVAGTAGIFAGQRMLLAEDIELNREIVLALLQDTGIEIDCAENGEKALQLFEQAPERYGVVVMDVQMPVMDGLEATRRIRALPVPTAKTVPIIAMTANAFAEDVAACKQAGMVDHVGKPIDVDVLVAKLEEYLPHG